MVSLKKLIAMVRKWKKVAGIGRRTISLPKLGHRIAQKGHFVVYTTDEKRFVLPLAYLSSKIFRELFRISEEKFGLPKDGPIILPCDSTFMEYVISLVQKSFPELEKALLVSLPSCQCLAIASISESMSYLQISIRGF